MPRKSPSTWNAARGAAWLALAFLPLLVAGCGAGSRLIVGDEMVASWVTVNNSFAEGGAEERLHRTGVLFQLGDCYDPKGEKAPKSILNHVLLNHGGETLLDLKRGDFTWINVVAGPSGTQAPMDPEHAFLLYPAPYKPSKLECDEDPTHTCLRNRKIHAHQEVQSIITYWQWDNGFSMEQKQLEGAEPRNNRQSFLLKDPVEITVYRQLEDPAGSGNWVMKPSHTFELGKVNRITITFVPGPPNHGARHDPAWPTEGGI